MPGEGEYLLASAGFSRKEKPLLVLQKDGQFIDFQPLGHTLTLKFDMTTRFCVGWHDLVTGDNFPCPDSNATNGKYDQCAACQKRTGFNPAFYHATSVSDQQEARNAQPHFLYLAHFAPGLVKVGISFAGRGNCRLLEQGARSAVILDTFPTANIARQYEAKIAKLSGVAETVQLQKKIKTLAHTYDPQKAVDELRQTVGLIKTELGTTFQNDEILTFDQHYFPSGMPDLAQAHDATNAHFITGNVTGMLGSLLFCDYQNTPLFLPAKKHVGYRVQLSYEATDFTLPAQQTSLF